MARPLLKSFSLVFGLESIFPWLLLELEVFDQDLVKT